MESDASTNGTTCEKEDTEETRPPSSRHKDQLEATAAARKKSAGLGNGSNFRQAAGSGYRVPISLVQTRPPHRYPRPRRHRPPTSNLEAGPLGAQQHGRGVEHGGPIEQGRPGFCLSSSGPRRHSTRGVPGPVTGWRPCEAATWNTTEGACQTGGRGATKIRSTHMSRRLKVGTSLRPSQGEAGRRGRGLRQYIGCVPADRTAEAGVDGLTRFPSKRGHAPKPGPLTSSAADSRSFGGAVAWTGHGGPICQPPLEQGPVAAAEAGEVWRRASRFGTVVFRAAGCILRTPSREQLPPRQSTSHRSPPSATPSAVRIDQPPRDPSVNGRHLAKAARLGYCWSDVAAGRADAGRGGHARHGHRRQGDAALDRAPEGDGLLCARHEEAATAGCSSPSCFRPFLSLDVVFLFLPCC